MVGSLGFSNRTPYREPSTISRTVASRATYPPGAFSLTTTHAPTPNSRFVSLFFMFFLGCRNLVRELLSWGTIETGARPLLPLDPIYSAPNARKQRFSQLAQ